MQGDARDLPLDDKPPWTASSSTHPTRRTSCYAELSDFFYVWLKRTAGYVFPEHFSNYLTDKGQEAIASPARFKSRATKGQSAKTLALADYQEKMAEIFAECRRVIKDDGHRHGDVQPQVHRRLGRPHRLPSSTRSSPSPAPGRSRPKPSPPCTSRARPPPAPPSLLVCRPREDNPYPKPWHEVEQLIAQAVQDDIRENLSQADLKPIDLYLSAFGPALRVISENWGTERESANPDRPEAPFIVTAHRRAPGDPPRG